MRFLSGTANNEFKNKTDKQLVSLFLEGNQQAFGTLYEKYKEPIFWQVHHILKTYKLQEEAHDITHDVFEKALDKLSTKKEKAPFAGWLRTIARNTAFDRLDSAKVRNRWNVPIKDDWNPFDFVALQDKGPLEIMGNNVLGERLAEVLDTLPEKQKEAFSFRYLEGLSVKETASRMGVGEGSVKTHFSRAVHKMRDLIDTDPESPNVVADSPKPKF